MILLDQQHEELRRSIGTLQRQTETGSSGLLPQVNSVANMLEAYQIHLETLIQSIQVLGFKDYGAIGEMRQEAHALELLSVTPDEKIVYLTLRRHEKDFLLRSDAAYFQKFLKVVREVRIKASLSRAFNLQLSQYEASFSAVVEINSTIGIETGEGQWGVVQKSVALLTSNLQDIQKKAEEWKRQQIGRIQVASIIIGILLLIASVVLAVVYSGRIASPILSLAKEVKDYVSRGFEVHPDSSDKISTLEINTLRKNIHFMQETIRKHLDNLDAQRKRAEEANKVKSFFLANISHEIMTPLNGITGTLELLKKPLTKEEEKELMVLLYQSAGDLTAVINDILNMSALESGELQIQKTWFSPEETIKAISAPYIKQAQNKNLDFALELNFHPAHQCLADSFRMSQILHNLIRNAIKFTNTGEIKVKAEIESSSTLIVEISDTGIGIDPIYHSSIFNPFFQVDPGSTRKYGGTGLGLATSQKLLTLMGGSISLNSVPGQGSTFIVSIPVSLKTDEGLSGSDVQDLISAKKVLVVEDQPVNQKIVSKLLRKMGHEPVVAENGQLGVDYFQSHPVDVVLMDIQMPVMDGISATRAIRSWENSQQKPLTPIIALTANATSADRDAAFSAGMNGFLTKPVNSEQLLSEIALILNNGKGRSQK